MINRLHSILFRPEKGFDPVPLQHAIQYGEAEWKKVNYVLINELEKYIGGLSGKRILDLGGGPGQYSVAFAKRGAVVTWYDISHIYKAFAEEKAKNMGCNINFYIGYLDEANILLKESYDLVFNRICWNYSISDKSFADIVFRLVRPGGLGYIDTNHSGCKRELLSMAPRFRTWLNDSLAIKIGHPFPPHGRLAHLFLKKQIDHIVIDYRSPANDRICFTKSLNAQ